MVARPVSYLQPNLLDLLVWKICFWSPDDPFGMILQSGVLGAVFLVTLEMRFPVFQCHTPSSFAGC